MQIIIRRIANFYNNFVFPCFMEKELYDWL